MDGNRLCCPESIFIAYLVLIFLPLATVTASISTRFSVFQLCMPRTGFLSLKIFLRFFFSLDKFLFKHFSKYTDLKIRKFVTVHFSEICNCFDEIIFLLDMARNAERASCYVTSIVYNFLYNKLSYARILIGSHS